MTNIWQKCPVCNGTGYIENIITSNIICKVCRGHCIISSITGRPPMDDEEGAITQDAPVRPIIPGTSGRNWDLKTYTKSAPGIGKHKFLARLHEDDMQKATLTSKELEHKRKMDKVKDIIASNQGLIINLEDEFGVTFNLPKDWGKVIEMGLYNIVFDAISENEKLTNGTYTDSNKYSE